MTELLLWLPILYPSFLSRKISIVLVHARVVKTGRVDQPLYPKNILHLVYFVWRFCHINKWGKFLLKHSWIIHWNQTLIPSRKKTKASLSYVIVGTSIFLQPLNMHNKRVSNYREWDCGGKKGWLPKKISFRLLYSCGVERPPKTKKRSLILYICINATGWVMTLEDLQVDSAN